MNDRSKFVQGAGKNPHRLKRKNRKAKINEFSKHKAESDSFNIINTSENGDLFEMVRKMKKPESIKKNFKPEGVFC